MTFAKIKFSAQIRLETGLHIGASNAFAAIGAIDSPVIKDPITNLPIIPGSSIKGKMRTLLAKVYNEEIVKNPSQDSDVLSRLFGNSEDKRFKMGRLIFRDAFLSNADELDSLGARSYTEVKFENTINRATAVANPRQIERVVRGAIFELDIIYEVENVEELLEDMQTLGEGMKLLQYDYLGGNGSRGYGKIVFKNLHAETVVGHLEYALIEQCNQILKKSVEG